MGKFLNFLKKIIRKKFFWVVLFIILGISGYAAAKNIQGKKVEYVTAEASIGNIRQTVSATGTIVTSEKMELTFKVSGVLKEIFVSEGDRVRAGDILARLEAKSAEIQVRQAEANLVSASANLNKLLAGASVEDVRISQESVNNAKISYENSKRDYEILVSKLEKDIETYRKTVASAEVALLDSQKNLTNAKVTYEQNILNAKNSAITSAETNLLLGNIVLNNINYNLSILVGIPADQQSMRNAETYRGMAVGEVEKAKNSLTKAKTSGDTDDIYQVLRESVSALNKIFNSLSYLMDAVSSAAASTAGQLSTIEAVKTGIKSDQNSITGAISAVQLSEQSLSGSQNSYQAQIDNYQAAVNTANNNLLSARTNLDAAAAGKDFQLSQSKALMDNAFGAYNLAKAQYDYKIAAPRSSDIAYYRSQVAQARAALDLVKNQLDEYTLIAPTDGTIAFVNYVAGEQTNFSKSIISMIGKNKFYAEIDIPESDITKIKVGNSVQITLDAYSEDIKFQGKVDLIYPAETIIQGVVYYKVNVEIDDFEKEVKSGMTVNADILTAQKDNVLSIPYRAVQDREGEKFIRVLVGGQPVLKNIKVGLRGDEGEVEIISGLIAGEKVIIFEKKK